jgi:predicted nucleic-acid-binding Zn-ribbon protein
MSEPNENHSSKSEVSKCPKCGGETKRRHLSGYYSTGLLSDSDSFWFPGKRDKVIAFVCQKCGFIELYQEMKEKKE